MTRVSLGRWRSTDIYSSAVKISSAAQLTTCLTTGQSGSLGARGSARDQTNNRGAAFAGTMYIRKPRLLFEYDVRYRVLRASSLLQEIDPRFPG